MMHEFELTLSNFLREAGRVLPAGGQQKLPSSAIDDALSHAAHSWLLRSGEAVTTDVKVIHESARRAAQAAVLLDCRFANTTPEQWLTEHTAKELEALWQRVLELADQNGGQEPAKTRTERFDDLVDEEAGGFAQPPPGEGRSETAGRIVPLPSAGA